jgi:hypothetical protein
MAFTTEIDKPARVNTRINKTVIDAIKPDLSPNNSVAITEILLPLCLTDAKRITISWTAPAKTTPIIIHNTPGK